MRGRRKGPSLWVGQGCSLRSPILGLQFLPTPSQRTRITTLLLQAQGPVPPTPGKSSEGKARLPDPLLAYRGPSHPGDNYLGSPQGASWFSFTAFLTTKIGRLSPTPFTSERPVMYTPERGTCLSTRPLTHATSTHSHSTSCFERWSCIYSPHFKNSNCIWLGKIVKYKIFLT